MEKLHVFAYAWQPLTRFIGPMGETVTTPERRVIRCHECRDWRWAKYLKVQAYYDYWRIQCSDGCYGERGGR